MSPGDRDADKADDAATADVDADKADDVATADVDADKADDAATADVDADKADDAATADVDADKADDAATNDVDADKADDAATAVSAGADHADGVDGAEVDADGRTAVREEPPSPPTTSRKGIAVAAVAGVGLAALVYAATRDGSKQPATGATVGSAAPSPPPRRYTVDDLEALVGKRGFREAVEHLGDIAAAQRDNRWLGAAAASAVGYLSETPPELRLELQESLERTWPALLQAPPYAAARDDLALPVFDHCFASSTEACGKLVASYVERGAPTATVIALGKLAQRRGLLPLALPLFRRAATTDAQVCRDPDFTNVALENIASEDGAALASVCWSVMRDRLRTYAAEPLAYGRASVCRLFAKHGEALQACAPR